LPQISATAAQSPHAHPGRQVREPAVEHVVVQDSVPPRTQANPSSVVPSQSSSTPLQISEGVAQAAAAGGLQVLLQVPVPVEPQAVVQATSVASRMQAKVSSITVSQSSSSPLQISVGGLQDPQAQELEQVWEPVVAQLVVQNPELPRTQAKVSSVAVSQSSSSPLHVSIGGVQAAPEGMAQVPVHVPLPVVPQVVAQDTVAPRMQANPLSTTVSQSSSSPLHVSAGGAHVPHAHEALHVREPVEPQVVVQGPELPREQANVSSVAPSQSSSLPLQTSAGGEHVPQAQP
jgi:hypothetical protein